MQLQCSLETFKEISKSSKVFYFNNVYDDGTNQSFTINLFCAVNPNIYKSILSDGYDLDYFYAHQSEYHLCISEADALALCHNELSLKRDVDGRLVSVSEPRVGDEIIYTTHNFCDPCTWFNDSQRIVDEVLSTSDNLVYTSVNQNWIDTVSGRLQNDEEIVEEQHLFNPSDPHGYRVVVTVNDVLKTMREPFEESGGDYSVYFEDGYIKFFTPLTGSDVVKCSYSHATTSTFILRPLPGKFLDIEGAESDFTHDVVMTDGIEYSIYGYVDNFAPQYMYKLLSGAVTVANNVVVGVGTSFLTEVAVGDYVKNIIDDLDKYTKVLSVISDTELELESDYLGDNSSFTFIVSKYQSGVYPSKYKIPLKTKKYKRFSNLTQEAVGTYPVVTCIGASEAHKTLPIKDFRQNSRGMKFNTQAIPFKYSTIRPLSDLEGLEVRVKTSHDRPLEGESATLTFYCTTK
ncbi:MAG: hypothetical protein LC122_13060 [Chitinophagales bacterium]|nr:hypothetical protein [Chitinophagales bacterium]